MAFPLQTFDQVLSVVISLVAMQVLKQIDTTSTQFLLYLRTFYILAITTNLLLMLLVKRRIKRRNDQRSITVPKPASLFAAEEEEEADITLTYQEYDLQEVERKIKGVLLQSVMIGLMHWKFKIIQPLILQILGPVKNLLFCPLFISYLFGKEIKRPYVENMFMERRENYKVVVEKVKVDEVKEIKDEVKVEEVKEEDKEEDKEKEVSFEEGEEKCGEEGDE